MANTSRDTLAMSRSGTGVASIGPLIAQLGGSHDWHILHALLTDPTLDMVEFPHWEFISEQHLFVHALYPHVPAGLVMFLDNPIH